MAKDTERHFKELTEISTQLAELQEKVTLKAGELRDHLLAMSDDELVKALTEFRQDHSEDLPKDVPSILSMVVGKRFGCASTRPRALDWVFDEIHRLICETNRK